MPSASDVTLLFVVLGVDIALVSLKPNITITGSVTKNIFTYDFINVSFNWFQALNYCKEAGYSGIDGSEPAYKKINAFTEFLRENVSNSQVTTWLAHFRPYPHLSDWYKHNCKTTRVNRVLGSYNTDEQCVILYYNDTDSTDAPEYHAANCMTRHPVLCMKFGHRKPFLYYEGYQVHSLLMEKYTDADLDKEECDSQTMKDANCPVYVYNHETRDCNLYTIPTGYGKVTYDLYFTGENVTAGVLDGVYTMKYTSDVNMAYSGVIQSFPDCGLDLETVTVPENYCKCAETSPEQPIIPRKTTGKYKRTLISATDKRLSSKVIGAVGLSVIIVSCCMVVLLDILTLVVNKKLCKF